MWRDSEQEARDRRAESEARVRRLCDGGDLAGAVNDALALYGDELLGFLAATSERRDRLAEIHAELCEALWQALPRFEWRASLRTWMYALARTVRQRHHERLRREEAHLVPLSQAPEPAAPDATSVALYRRSTMKQRLELARSRLTPEERELLVLRVDRGLGWAEVATIVDETLREAPAGELERAAAALRKRFERTLERLRRIFEELRAQAGGEKGS